jgi:hypothetical protein
MGPKIREYSLLNIEFFQYQEGLVKKIQETRIFFTVCS